MNLLGTSLAYIDHEGGFFISNISENIDEYSSKLTEVMKFYIK